MRKKEEKEDRKDNNKTASFIFSLSISFFVSLRQTAKPVAFIFYFFSFSLVKKKQQ